MNATIIDARLYVDDSHPVIDAAARVGHEAAKALQSGQNVVVSVRGVRGASSSFFNVLLSSIAGPLASDFAGGRFKVETETPTQALVWERSKAAFLAKNAHEEPGARGSVTKP